ncbi:MAG: DNA methyltransferase [Candidatus Thorarchaeota archaeon]|nr:DNA methyltransferase [Candidatus Thorarchaeota archaeon]
MHLVTIGVFIPLKRAIESTFPIAKINQIAEGESTGFGRRHYRPVYVMHKWWARRLGSIFRSIILYSLADEKLTSWDKKAENLWKFYSQDVQLHGKVVLDPMMGGGTTVVEALKLGCKVVGGDLNPVAWFIVKKSVEDIDPELLRQALTNINRDLGNDLRKYYRTTCPECGKQAEGIYYFYYKEVLCPKCAKAVPLMRNFFLAKSPTRRNDYVVCPNCWNVFQTKNAKKVTKCPCCDEKFIAMQRKFIVGRKFKCHDESCGTHSIVKTIQSMSERPKEKLYAIEFYCEHCDLTKNEKLKNGRGYKTSDEMDNELLAKATEEFLRVGDSLPIPRNAIPDGVETRRAHNHGYRDFKDLFNSRQLLNLGKIYRWILNISDQNLKEFMILAFSNCLKYNNMFAKYNATRGFITDIFRTHSISPSLAPVEANCYDTKKGRGAFTAFVNLVIEGKEYCRAPFERIIDGKSKQKVTFRTKIEGKLARSYSDFDEDATVFLRCGSSDSLPIPDSSVDAVITDPPYFGNVMYSELSNFFYVWLKLGLKDKYQEFKPEFVPWFEEIIENRVQAKGREEYIRGLEKVLSEAHRVLASDGVLVFTFHHTKFAAWGALLEALLTSEFYITATYPVRSEMRASTHLHGMMNISYDMVFVCRKREIDPNSITWSTLLAAVMKSVNETTRDLEKNGQLLSKQDILAIVLGKWLQLYSRYYPNVTNEKSNVNPDLALSLIERNIVRILQDISMGSL